MKTYIIGTGGVGGYFGGKLALAGNDVTFLARGEHYNAIKINGLTVNSVDGSFNIIPTKVIDSIEQVENPELIIISVKTYDIEKISKQLSKKITKDTIIITFQNGVENDIEIKKYLTSDKIYPGIAFVISTKGESGVINQTGGLKKLVFGVRNNSLNINQDIEQLKKVEKMFIDSEINAVLSDDIERDLWKKFIFINAFAGFTALCRCTIGEIINDKYLLNLYEKCVLENIEVAKSLNINLPDTIYEDIMTLSNNTAPTSKSSLLHDIENGRKNEIESINGTLVKIAKRNGIYVPINSTIYAAIKMLK